MRSVKQCCTIAAILACFLSSCVGSKPVQYFNGALDTTILQSVSIPEPIIQIGDLLSITIFSDNPEATAIYNQAGVNSAPVQSTSATISKTINANTNSAGTTNGYLVDKNGNIRLHAIGLVKAAGLTKEQLMDTITTRLLPLQVLNNPYTVVRFSNFRVTVLGEVRTPGVFSIPGEKASLLEALGLAGDISDYGIKDKILLIREYDGKRTYHNINLTDPSVFTSEYFYLRQNDIVVVQPDSKKPTARDQKNLQYVTVGAAVISSIAIFLTLFL
jgi:polysaccharide biosynthesis/export protein